VSKATWTSGLPVSLAARALALTTSALIEDAIIFFLVFRHTLMAENRQKKKGRGL
jgi:hypothetical protein